MPRVKSRIVSRYYATPGTYDAVVYTENNRYYAKDRKGNVLCTDSPTACIQEAIDYVSSRGGGTVFLKSGIYELSRNIILRDKVSLIGEGVHSTRLYPTTEFDYMISIDKDKDYSLWFRRISDLYIHCQSRVKYGIYAAPRTGGPIAIERTTIVNPITAAIFQGLANGVWVIRDNVLLGGSSKGYGMWLDSPGDSHYVNNDIFGFAIGIYAVGVANSTFINNRTYLSRYYDDVQYSGTGMHLHLGNGVRIFGDRHNDHDNLGLRILNSNAVSVIGVLTIHNGVRCTNTQCYGYGILIYNSSDVIVKGSISINDYGIGISAIGGRRYIIEGNIVKDPCYSTEYQGYCRAYDIYGVNNIILKNNYAVDTRSSPIMKEGFTIGGGSNNVLYADLVSIGHTSKDVQVYLNEVTLLKNEGIAKFSGDGATTQFTITHRLSRQPSTVIVTPLSADAAGPFYVSSDSTYIYINYKSPPPAGTNNIVLYWYAKI
jgi:hypothetical protein